MKEKLIYGNKGHELTVVEKGKEIRVRNPLSTYHIALMEYREDFDLDFIVLFEKLIVFYRSARFLPFYYQQNRLIKELHIKRSRLVKARALLIKVGILNEVNPGKGKKIRFSLNRDRIIDLVPYLYKIPKEEPTKAAVIKELQTFFKFYLSKSYLSDKSDPSIPNIVKEGRFDLFRNDTHLKSETKDENDENNTHKKEE